MREKIKSSVSLANVGVEVDKIRRTRIGELLVQIEKTKRTGAII